MLYFYCLQVSLVPNRTLEKEVETTAQILLSLLRTKRPVVLVTTKNDEGNEIFVREAERLINRKGTVGVFFGGVHCTTYKINLSGRRGAIYQQKGYHTVLVC